MPKKKSNTDENKKILVNIDGECPHEIVNCDVVSLARIGQTFYVNGVQFNPEDKLAAAMDGAEKIRPNKKITLVLDKDGFIDLMERNEKFINQLKDQGII